MIYFRNICFGILGEDLFVVDLNKIVAFHCENDLEKFAVDLKNYGFSHLLASNLGRKRFVIFDYRPSCHSHLFFCSRMIFRTKRQRCGNGSILVLA